MEWLIGILLQPAPCTAPFNTQRIFGSLGRSPVSSPSPRAPASPSRPPPPPPHGARNGSRERDWPRQALEAPDGRCLTSLQSRLLGVQDRLKEEALEQDRVYMACWETCLTFLLVVAEWLKLLRFVFLPPSNVNQVYRNRFCRLYDCRR